MEFLVWLTTILPEKQDAFVREEICHQSNFDGVAVNSKWISVRRGDSEMNQRIFVTSAKLGLTQASHKKRCMRHAEQDTDRYKNI